ncbi:MAG: cell division protein FtsA [Candidatus Shapirobacteria bacterium]
MSKKSLTAIDIGSSKIATLVAGVGEEGEVRVLGTVTLPSKGIKRGQIVNIEEAVTAITSSVEAAERMAGLSLSQAVVSIGGAQIASQNSKGVVAVARPEGEITSEDVRRVIEAARAVSLPSSREILHVIPRYYIVDGQEGVRDPVGMSGVRLEVETHLITGSGPAARNLVKCLDEVGIGVRELVMGGLAAAESVLTETEKELGVVLVDIGGGTTSVVVFVEGAPFYSVVLPVGARNVTNDLAIGLRLSLEEAEKMKIDLAKGEGEEDEKKRKMLVEGIIRPRLNEIFELVGEEIKKSGAAGLTPAGLVVTGGGAQTPGVIESAKRMLAMAARIGQPSGLVGLVDEIQSPDLAVAAGLLLLGVKKEGFRREGFSLEKWGKKLPKLPVKGLIIKLIDLIKSLLP